MKPKVISTETIYEGRIFDLQLTEISEGASEYKREIVVHHGSAVIVPVFSDDTIALVRQYRHAAQKYLLEIPAGTLEENENPEEGARREVEEEIGVIAGKIEKLTEFYVSPGFLTEKMHVFLATDLRTSKQNLDDDEFLSIEKFTFPQAFEMIKTGEIEDAKTMVGIIMAGAKLGFVYN
ncbi:MAG TPA: NUDIX hydrolase [Pyrinomonadaceae bacterium]|nr:NUDIX hydrolase [Pyrinomonadaceae bacterium]